MTYEVYTEINIQRAPAAIWKVLTDFSAYPSWNPFIQSIEGDVSKEKQIKVSAGGMKFKPVVLNRKEEKFLSWKGRLVLPGVFDGVHSFELKQLNDGSTMFIHREVFSGVLVRFFKKKLSTEVKQGFIDMNHALKKKVEQVA